MFEDKKQIDIKQDNAFSPPPAQIPNSALDSDGITTAPSSLMQTGANQSARIKTRSKSWIIMIVAAVTLAGILGGGYYAHSKGYIAIPFISPNADAIVAKMMKKMSDVKSMTFNVAASLEEKNKAGGNNWQLQATLSGKQEDSAADITAELAIDATYSHLTERMPFSGEFKILDDKIYFNISEIPTTLYDLGDMQNQWYYLESSDAASSLKTLSFGLNANDLTEEQYQQIKNLVSESAFIKVNKVLEEQTIQDVACYHYDVNLDSQGMVTFVQKASDILDQNTSDQIIADLDDVIAGLSEMNAEIWIGKSDNYLHQIMVDASKKTNPDFSDPNKYLAVIFTIQLSEHNQAVEVAVPEEVEELNIEELMAEVFGTMFMGPFTNGMDLTTDTDSDGLLDYLEANYKCDPNKEDTDDDGFKDGEEVKNGYNPNGEGELDSSKLFELNTIN